MSPVRELLKEANGAEVERLHEIHDVAFSRRTAPFAACYLTDFFLAAQYFFIRSACCLRCDVVNRRFFLAGAAEIGAVAPAATAAREFFGGRPRRFAGPCRASIARLSLSRS